MGSESRSFDREAALRSGAIHDENHEKNRRRLRGFYGRVAELQNQAIVAACAGQRILDVGAGYGHLTQQLADAGFDAVGIEVDEQKIARASRWFDIRLRFGDFYAWPEDQTVDTVVFRESLNHLDLGTALSKAFRIAEKRCLVFQGTEILPLRTVKRLYHHEEHAQKTPEIVLTGLREAGFDIRDVVYRDSIAFPLSGGWWGRAWVPSIATAERTVLKLDAIATWVVNAVGLGRLLCFRFLAIAEKPVMPS